MNARGWVAPLNLDHALIDFDFTRPVGPVDVLISTDGTITASIDIGADPRDNPWRWHLYTTHPTLAVGYHERPDHQGPLILVRIALVRVSDPDTPPWTLED